MTKDKSLVVAINDEINRELADPKVCQALLATTFKGLELTKMKQAIMEGMIRGFNFKNFLEKDVYAIPFSGGYSLVTSVDYARKRGMRSGIVGKDKPVYVIDEKTGKIISCSVTVHRNINGYVGSFTAEVFFDEYSTGRNLWVSKPRTMIAKVAEMHALRMACPEELSQTYLEEEFDSENKTSFSKRLSAVEKDKEELKMGKFLKENGKDKKKDGEETQITPDSESNQE